MKKNKEYRSQALTTLESNWGSAALVTVVFCVVVQLLSSGPHICMQSVSEVLSLTASVTAVLTFPLSFAYTVAFLRLKRGRDLAVGDLFRFYGTNKVWIVMLLKNVYLLLWTMLLIIPGIIKSYSYAMTEYIVLDNPELGADDAIKQSMKMMKGKKMKLFLLDLSFVGWILLSILTMGLGFILLYPYINSAHAAFYEDMKAETVVVAA